MPITEYQELTKEGIAGYLNKISSPQRVTNFLTEASIEKIIKKLKQPEAAIMIRFESLGHNSSTEMHQLLDQLAVKDPNLLHYVDWLYNEEKTGVIGFDLYLTK